ncbi:hypothetical protein FN846DRAFT_917293 [Sphaerosporella brunnea]|uniref:Integral membrane protein n=1 Tax=Sphaerosporella brunnea TaxID=1250544 RepID=A0A5J5F4A7_9PEZI|nr:hypothetical protein FN846DRAFT_917293 [Sphaerosporella brunnea]
MFTRDALGMVRKRKARAFTWSLVLLCVFMATARAQEILVFNSTTGLPDCAYSCTDLYSAQYDCQHYTGNRTSCFCETSYIDTKPKGWGCDEVCPINTDRQRVSKYLQAVCGTSLGVDSTDNLPNNNNNNNTTTEGGNSHNSTATVSDDKSNETNDSRSEKGAHWWRKNWPFFFLALMVVITSILVLAFAGPLRKYLRRRRSRQLAQATMPTYWPPAAAASTISSVHPPSRHYSNAYSSMSTRSKEGYLSSGMLDTPAPLSPAITPQPGRPAIRTLFASQLATGSDMRLETGGTGHENSGWWSKLAFWRKSSTPGNVEKRVSAREAYFGRLV